MDLLHLVDRLEELVASSQKMPIGNRAIIDRRRLLDIADQMRIAVPQEVREAQEMVANRERQQREADEEARMVVARAEQEASRLVAADQITESARRRAEEIAAQAEARLQERIAEANNDIQDRLVQSRQLSEQQMSAADAYARELLERLERQLQAFVRSVQSGVAQLETEPGPSAPPPAEMVGEPPPASPIDDAAAGAPPLHADPLGDPPARPLEGLPGLDAPQPAPVASVEPGVIDDFELPQLDDDPTQRPGTNGSR